MNVFARLVRASVRLLDRLPAGAGAPKLYWRYRHLVEGKDWIRDYFASQDDPQRLALIEHVIDTPDATRCFEVGCNSGANLGAIAARRPEWELLGIDINPKAVEIGRRMFASEGVTTVRLEHRDVEDLSWLEDDTVDVTFTDAALMYVPPKKLPAVLDQLARVTSRRLVFNEFVADGTETRLGGYWAHDFVGWAEQRGFAAEVHESPRRPAGGNWGAHGGLVKVSLG